MRYFNDNKDFLREQLARLIAIFVLLLLGWGAFLVWRWLMTMLN